MSFKHLFLNLKIRFKLMIAFGSILLLSVILVLVAINGNFSILSLRNLGEKVDMANLRMSQVNIYLQEFASKGFKTDEFLSTGSSQLTKGYQTEMDSILHVLSLLKNNDRYDNKDFSFKLNTIASDINEFDIKFQNLVALYQKRGFEDYGLEGQLRDAIHEVEEAHFPYNKVQMLMLRRHEKDFFLRKDLKYLDRFNQAADIFRQEVAKVNDELVGKAQVLLHINEYQTKFNDIVEVEQKIGLTSSSGILGELNQQATAISDQLRKLTENVKQTNKAMIDKTIYIIIGLFGAQLIIGMLLGYIYSHVFTKSITQIKDAMVSLAKGKFPEKLKVKSSDELAETKTALNQLVERIKVAVDFARNLGAGNFSVQYDEKYNKDVLAKSIIALHQKLQEADQEQFITNWSNEGMAKINGILKNHSASLEILGDDIICQIVNYLNVNQGALYLIDGNELQRLATYAYNKKRFVNQKIAMGTGLVGQCVLEKECVYITDLPPGYTSITSGLGECTPSSLLIVPLIARDHVIGAIELAALRKLKAYEIEFVKKLSESIASILMNNMSNQKKEATEAKRVDDKYSSYYH
ncbi:GAF domain-containing protein [Fulvivirga sediminis]|uniref:GAF domain-containing protein n=1 Tax=Fulvivirga sediminis TaxID=2803949 RepID=A0A937F8Z5_9BACT|nr:GAF domain-containing protein [Fulvivirga sediminis]MBL3657890.1 GAF domain-containing protein [Fulvivirga sediminis]